MKTLKAMAKIWKQHAASLTCGEEDLETNDADECLFSAFKIHCLETLYYNNTFTFRSRRHSTFAVSLTVIGRRSIGHGWPEVKQNHRPSAPALAAYAPAQSLPRRQLFENFVERVDS